MVSTHRERDLESGSRTLLGWSEDSLPFTNCRLGLLSAVKESSEYRGVSNSFSVVVYDNYVKGNDVAMTNASVHKRWVVSRRPLLYFGYNKNDDLVSRKRKLKGREIIDSPL